jgi:ribosome-associated protein
VKGKVKTKPDESMKDLWRDCLLYLDEKKAIEPVFMDLRKVNSYLSYFIIATGNSQTHCRALARDISKFLFGKEIREYGSHDLDSEWIVLDFGDLIVHIFTEDIRSYYQLEKLWADAEVISLN